MAMNIPKSGYNRFMKEGAQHFKGTDEAVLRNIDACVELASQLRSAYGPNGMNKMVINHIEKLFVTNDAATILKELDIQHPAAKIIIMASQMQEKQVGDNTNTVVILAAALLEHGAQLISMGLTPQEVAAGYEQAAEKALEILPNLVIKEATDLRDIPTSEKKRMELSAPYLQVKKLLRSAITSKQYDNEEAIADLVSKACVLTVPKNSFNFNVDNIRICKILGSGVSTSMVMNGMVFKRGAEGEVKSVKNARIAVFTCPFDLTQTETKGTVLIENAEELMGFAKGEESEVESQVKALADNGVQVVVAAGKFGDLYLHFLNKYKIMGVRLTSKFDLRRLCRTVGAQAQARICAPAVNLLGTCDSVHIKEIGDENVVVFDNKGEKGHVATIIIRGSSQSRIDDVERAVDDAVNTYKCLTKDARLLPGAGAVEIELARQIESFGEKCSGLEQYAIKKFAYALETLPKCLAENAGIDATDILTKLNAAHESGQPNVGIDIWKHEVMDAGENTIYDLFAGKKSAIKLATDAAATILKVDQIIIAKQATGGPKPRGPKPQDEDEEGMA
ncbi:T-complex protein 1, theta subunit [Cooperia oncophora]